MAKRMSYGSFDRQAELDPPRAHMASALVLRFL